MATPRDVSLTLHAIDCYRKQLDAERTVEIIKVVTAMTSIAVHPNLAVPNRRRFNRSALPRRRSSRR